MYTKFPKARRENIISNPVGDELVVFDRLNNRAHSMEPLAATIWSRCDGRTTVEELVDAVRRHEDISVSEARERLMTILGGFSDSELLETGSFDRRDFLGFAGKAAAASFVATVLVPRPTSAQSVSGPACCTTFATANTLGFCNDVDGCCCTGTADANGPDVVIVCNGTTAQTCQTDCENNFGGGTTFQGNCSGV